MLKVFDRFKKPAVSPPSDPHSGAETTQQVSSWKCNSSGSDHYRQDPIQPELNAEELLAALPKEFYADGFNPLDYIFSYSPEDLDEVWLNQQIDEKEKIKAVVESNLSDRVLTSYGDFGK